MTITDEDIVRFAAMWEQATTERARGRDPEAATQVLTWAIADLRSGVLMSEASRAFLADALEQCLADPRKSGQALGLIGKRQRPKSPESALLHRDIVKVLKRLEEQGFLPYMSKRSTGENTFEAVARQFGVQPITVRRAWEDFKKLEASMAGVLETRNTK